MDFRNGPPLVWLLLTLGVCAAVAVAVSAASRRRTVPGGGIVNAFRITFSAPQFLVPAAMTAVAVGIGLAILDDGGNPWLADGTEGLAIHGGVILVVAAGLAGQVGLLEAHRAGRAITSDAFLDGIRSYTLAIFLAKVLITGATYALILPGFSPWDLVGDFEPIHAYYRSFDTYDVRSWLLVAIPSFLLSPVLGAVALHPGRPVRSVFSAIGTASRHPWTVARVLALQALVLSIAVALTETSLYWRESDEVVRLAVLTHGPTLSFHLFPFLAFAGRDAMPLLLLITIPLSAVFVTAYWSISAQRQVVETPAASV